MAQPLKPLKKLYPDDSTSSRPLPPGQRNGQRPGQHLDDGQKPGPSGYKKWRQDWGDYMSSKTAKEVQQFQEYVRYVSNDGPTSQLFAGVCIYVDGYTEPSALELRHLMALHGGEYMNHLHKRVTHVVAEVLPFAKMRLNNDKLKIVTTEWITRSLELKRLLPCQDYPPRGLAVQENVDIRLMMRPESRNSTWTPAMTKDYGTKSGLKKGTLSREEPKQSSEKNQSTTRIEMATQESIDDPMGDEDVICETPTNQRIGAKEMPPPPKRANIGAMPETMSQVDLKILKELPKNLQKEMEMIIETKQKIKDGTLSVRPKEAPKIVPKKTPKKSPKKSPKKGKKAATKGKAPAVKKNQAGPLDKMFKSMANTETRPLLSLKRLPKEANICGKTDIVEVSVLLREWIKEEPDLIDEDVAYVTKYFCDLIDQKKISELIATTTQLYYAIEERKQGIWCEAYNDMMKTVEQELRIMGIPGMRLFLFQEPYFDIETPD